MVLIGDQGKDYLKTGLPERHVLDVLKKGKETIVSLTKKTKLSPQEISASIGQLRKNAAVEFVEKELQLTTYGEKLASSKTRKEEFLEALSSGKDVK